MSSYLKDLAGRVASTAAFTFLSVFSLDDMSTAKVAAVAAGAAALSLLKGALGKFIGSEDHAGWSK